MHTARPGVSRPGQRRKQQMPHVPRLYPRVCARALQRREGPRHQRHARWRHAAEPPHERVRHLRQPRARARPPGLRRPASDVQWTASRSRNTNNGLSSVQLFSAQQIPSTPQTKQRILQ